ncbi:MAG: ABC transporter substrate-binding protein [Sphingomonadales bacterium]|jgi:ABC-type branched-subunit amino acid transport system substrate-binding protein
MTEIKKSNVNDTSRRSFLKGTSALAAAGWIGALTGGFVLKPDWAHAAGSIKMGIATDITGGIAPSGNANWQTAQFAAKQINDAGGILGRPIELILEDTASDPGIAVGNVRRLVERHNVDVILGGITSSMREAIKNPIVKRGKTLYIYPQLYEGQECTPHLYCTGPTPYQQCAELIPYLIAQGNKRFAMPSANYRWPQLLNIWTKRIIEEHGGEVVLEEYFPIDQVEYSATVGKIKSEKVDHVFLTIIPPGLGAFTKQLYETGFHSNGGTLSCVYYDENSVNYVAPRELEGVYSCLDYFHTVDDTFSNKALAGYNEMWPDSNYKLTAGTAATGMYRGIKLFEAGVNATNGDLDREAVSAAIDGVTNVQGMGGEFSMVPGTGHAAMNMYVAQANGGVWDIIKSANQVPPNECA